MNVIAFEETQQANKRCREPKPRRLFLGCSPSSRKRTPCPSLPVNEAMDSRNQEACNRAVGNPPSKVERLTELNLESENLLKGIPKHGTNRLAFQKMHGIDSMAQKILTAGYDIRFGKQGALKLTEHMGYSATMAASFETTSEIELLQRAEACGCLRQALRICQEFWSEKQKSATLLEQSKQEICWGDSEGDDASVRRVLSSRRHEKLKIRRVREDTLKLGRPSRRQKLEKNFEGGMLEPKMFLSCEEPQENVTPPDSECASETVLDQALLHEAQHFLTTTEFVRTFRLFG